MGSGKIFDVSEWLTATPAPVARRLPFYITEAGHFLAYEGYSVKRSFHDSFLLLYTIKGEGALQGQDGRCALPAGCAAVLDCHGPHGYRTASRCWEFLWMHFRGHEMEALMSILYPEGLDAIPVRDPAAFQDQLSGLTGRLRESDVENALRISAEMHGILALLNTFRSGGDRSGRGRDHQDDIEAAVSFIKANYSRHITVDDLVEQVHVSKYHFIRLFGRKMGTTPYHYLTSYRINQSKLLLCTTSMTVEEIAYRCGFSSASNFIQQFRKQTGSNPLRYRRDFTP